MCFRNSNLRTSQTLRGLALGLLVFYSVPSMAQTNVDILAVSDGESLAISRLSDREFEPLSTLSQPIRAMALPPAGPVLTLIDGETEDETFLAELFGMTDIQPLVELDFDIEPYDISFGPDARLFAVAPWFQNTVAPPAVYSDLFELDPQTGEILGRYRFDLFAERIAPSPTGVWLVERRRISNFDITRRYGVRTTEFVFDSRFEDILGAATDTQGNLWIAARTETDPPVVGLWRYDPDDATFELVSTEAFPVEPTILAIGRVCQESATVRCLLDGRFQVRVLWEDFEQRTGSGFGAPSGTPDSALFWFFEPSNWELLVKVIDGCAENGHFWVFSAGTTNTAYTLHVRDVLTGEVFTSSNPLGQASNAVTATDAFATCDVMP